MDTNIDGDEMMIKDKDFNCCGCSACTVVCPVKCITMSNNDEGFQEPKLCNDNCINCDLCEKVCPILSGQGIKNKNIKAMSAFSKNETVRSTCSSGGVAFEISKLLLEQGYKICAVRYNYEKNCAEHYIANNLFELEESKGSKYIQSSTEEAFKEIFDGDKYVVIGSPCQISGVEKIAKIKKMEENFIFIDFFCHGVPSRYVWDNYIKFTRSKYKINDISRIKFRDKKNGWHNFTISIDTEKKVIYSDKDKDRDLFYQFFLGNHALNKCCYSCDYRLDISDADIRIGDMWGKKYESDIKGISGILSFTQKGHDLMKSLNDITVIKSEEYGDVVEGQMHTSISEPLYRRRLIKDMRSNKNMRWLYYKYIVSHKIKRRLKIKQKGK